MKTQIGQNNSLLVFLDKKEAAALHIGSNMCLESEQTRQIIYQIFRQAAAEADYRIHPNTQKLIEILPFEDGSVLLCFSPQRRKPSMQITVRRKTALTVYEFEDSTALESFVDAAAHLKELSDGVYKSDGTYRFVLTESKGSLAGVLEEFATRLKTPLSVARTQEYWQKI